MFSPTSPFLGGTAFGSGGSSGFSGRDIVWVDLRFPDGVGNNGTEELPFSTANIGLGVLPSGGTLVMVGGDASAEAGVNIAAGSAAFIGWGGQRASGGLTPVLPTLTYAITTGTQRLAFRNISVALVHSGTAASLSEFYFEFCPSVTLTAGGDASPVYWVGAPGNTFSGSGGAAQFVGGTIAGYTANSGGAVSAAGSNITSDITSSSTITLTAGCTFGGALSITAPTINVDITTLYNATIAGVTFSSTVHLLVPMGTPSDIGTANSTGTATTLLPSDHVHRITFTTVNATLAGANASISINGQKITGSGAPTAGTDLVTKTYADAIAVGLKVKTPAVAVATANQATMSGTAQTIDGVALNTIGQRVLLTAQSTATQNGLWVVAAGAWTRPTDFLTGSGAAQSYVLVTGGTVNGGSSYFCTNASGSDVVDTASLTWVLFSQAAVVNAGAGMTKTGNTLDVIAGDATIVVHADDIVVGVIGNANLADNTIALARLVNAGGQSHFLMRKSASAGPWEDGTASDAKTALGIFGNPSALTVRAATTANITLSGTQTVDGVALIANDRCLVKNQTTGANNGVYVVAAGAWARSSDAASVGQLFGGLLVPISEGTANGNQVAQLTTDDPITIGSTALTFSMGRAAAIGAVSPLDVTKAAASIGTSTLAAPIDHKHDITTAAPVAGAVVANGSAAEGTATTVARSDHIHAVAVATPVDIGTANAAGSAATFVRSDHVHALTFTVAAAVLAVASTSISVNSQKITSLATPTVATDAATKGYVDSVVLGFTPPANPGDNGKIAYASAGAIVFAANIKTDGTRYQFGVTGTGGLLNFAQNSNIIFGANNAGTQVVPLMRWGSASPVALVDGIYIGSTSGDAGKVAAMRFGVDTGGTFQWEVNGTAVSTITSQGKTVTPAATTGTVASALRVTDAAHTALTLSTERISVLFDFGQTRQWATGALTTERAMRVVAPTIAFVGASTVTTAATVAISGAPAAGTNATITRAYALWVETGGIGIGATPATSAAVNFANNVTGLAFRDSLNSADVPAIQFLSDNAFRIGDDTTTVAHYIKTKTGGFFDLQVNNTDEFIFNASSLNFKDNIALFGTNPSTNALINATNNSTILGGKTGGGNNSVILSWSTANDITIGDNTTNTNDIYLAPNSAVHVYLGAAEEYRFTTTFLDFKDNQARFGASPSTNATVNFPSTSAALLGAKNISSADRSLVSWSGTDVVTFGSSALITLVAASGGSWIFGSTASFPGVGHNIAAGGFLSFDTTPAGIGTIRFPGGAQNAVRRRNNGNSANISVLAWDTSDNMFVGDTAAGGQVVLDVATGKEFNFRVNGSNVFDIKDASKTIDCHSNSLKIDNIASVPSAPGSGGYLYAEGGAGKWVSSSGTRTTFGFADPHCPRCGADFAHEWESPKYGKLSYCSPCLIDALARAGVSPDEYIIERKAAA